jgi:hypothetical protein
MTPTINLDRLEELADERERLAGLAEAAHRQLLDELVSILDAGAGLVNIAELAKRSRVSRATIYNELGRRQDTADVLSGNGHPPAPAPADTDQPAAG